MPKSGVDGPSYAGHVNVAPEGSEPEWVLEQDAPAVPVVEPVAPAAPVAEAKPEPVNEPAPRRTRKR